MNSALRRISAALLLNLGFLLVLTLTASAQSVGQIRLGSPAGDDWEPSVTADHSGHVYVLWPHYGGVADCANCPNPTALLQVSANRGQTWSAPRIVTPDHLDTYQVGMQIVVDPVDGRTLYASWLQNDKRDTVVTKSTNLGRTWSAPVVVDHTADGTDKPILAVRGHDVYVSFNHQSRMFVAASHDGGATFTSFPLTQNGDFVLALAGGAAVDSQGAVYVAWAGFTANGDGRGPVNLYIDKSTDGGKTWTSTLLDTSGSPPDCSAYNCGWTYLGAQAVLTIDAHDTLYAAWNASAADKGPARIYFARSTDGAATWSTKQDLSLAPAGVAHAFPAVTSGGTGNVHIAWMDARAAPMWNVYYRTSDDSGATWSSETQLSSYIPGYPYLDARGFAFPYGDYMEMSVDDHGATHVVWGEGPNWVGPGNIWYARVAH